MKKLYSQSNPYYLLLLFLFLTLSLIINSCKKEKLIVTPPNGDKLSTIDINRFKSIYNSETRSETSLLVTKTVSPGQVILNLIQNMDVKWDSYFIIHRPDSSKVTEFELHSDTCIFTPEPTFKDQVVNFLNKSSVVFIERPDGTSLNFFMKVIEKINSPVEKNLLKEVHYKTIPKGFNGQVMFYSLDRKYLNGYNYVNGNITGTISITPKKNNEMFKVQTLSNKKKNLKEEYCEYIDVYSTGYCGANYYIQDDGSPSQPYYWCVDGIYLGTIKICDSPSPGGGGGGDDTGGVVGDGGSSNGNQQAEIRDLLTKALLRDPNFLLSCDSLQLLEIASYQSYGSMFQQVAQYNPPQAVLNRITSLQSTTSLDFDTFNLQNLHQAYGATVNSDFFPVRITQMPTGMDNAGLTEYFRTHINTFITGGTRFDPYNYDGVDDRNLFNQPGNGSVGALVSINMLNNGTVIESDYQTASDKTYFKFSTMTSPLDNNHPVSGNREFGVYNDPGRPGEHTFYIMGVDRVSDWQFAVGNRMVDGFNIADNLWTDIQTQMIAYINSHGGHADTYNKPNYIARPDYNAVQDYLDGTIDLAELKQRLGCD